jgi:hypothetical protein
VYSDLNTNIWLYSDRELTVFNRLSAASAAAVRGSGCEAGGILSWGATTYALGCEAGGTLSWGVTTYAPGVGAGAESVRP